MAPVCRASTYSTNPTRRPENRLTARMRESAVIPEPASRANIISSVSQCVFTYADRAAYDNNTPETTP